MQDPEEASGAHLDPREISAYLDDRLSPGEKERVQAHLADCSTCRGEVSELVDLLGSQEKADPRRRRGVVLTGLAAAAVIVLLFSVPLLRQAGDGTDVLRGPETTAQREAVRSIAVVSPEPGAPVSRESVAFAWESMGENVSYRLTVTDAGGSTVWTLETDSTSVEPPPESGLRPAETYLWYVDAVLPDGTTATTGVKRLRIGP